MVQRRYMQDLRGASKRNPSGGFDCPGCSSLVRAESILAVLGVRAVLMGLSEGYHVNEISQLVRG